MRYICVNRDHMMLNRMQAGSNESTVPPKIISLADLEKAYKQDKTLAQWVITENANRQDKVWLTPKVAQILGCHSDQSKYCEHCLRHMEDRLCQVFTEITGSSVGGDNRHMRRAVLNYIYYVAGDEANAYDGQKHLYSLWEQEVTYMLDHTPIFNAKVTDSRLGFTGVFWFDAHTPTSNAGCHNGNVSTENPDKEDYVLRVK